MRNLLEFPGHFSRCHTVALNVNHRSHPAIVDFYDRWMATAADWSNPDPQGRPFRHPKSITSHGVDMYQDYPAVIRVEGRGAGEEGTQLAELLRFLKRERVIAEYGQVALLLHSVRGTAAAGYLDALERAGIPVNRTPSGYGGPRVADEPRALTVTTVHQAKGKEWGRCDRGITGLLQSRRGPGGPGTPALLPAPFLRAGSTAPRPSITPASTMWPSPGRGVCWC